MPWDELQDNHADDLLGFSLQDDRNRWVDGET